MTRLHVLARGREEQGEAVSGVVVHVVTGIWLTGTKKAKRRRGWRKRRRSSGAWAVNLATGAS